MKTRTEVAAEVVAAEITRVAEAEEEKRTGKISRVKTPSLASKRERMMIGLLMPRRSKSTESRKLTETNLMT